jgi:hypothetical protein
LLARLYQTTGRPAKAVDVLAPVLEVFLSTPEMPQIAEAQRCSKVWRRAAHCGKANSEGSTDGRIWRGLRSFPG